MQRQQFYPFAVFGKSVTYFAGFLYLLGFSLNGVNVLGKIDSLIPYERTLSLIVSVSLLVLFVNQLVALWKCVEWKK